MFLSEIYPYGWECALLLTTRINDVNEISQYTLYVLEVTHTIGVCVSSLDASRMNQVNKTHTIISEKLEDEKYHTARDSTESTFSENLAWPVLLMQVFLDDSIEAECINWMRVHNDPNIGKQL